MWDFWSQLFDTRGFDPLWVHGTAFSAGLGIALMVAHITTALAYFTIPVIVLFFLLRRRDVRWSRLWVLFFVLLVIGGLVHFMAASTFWWPAYRFHVVLNVAMAAVSWVAVIALIPIVPRLLSSKSGEEFSHQISKHEEAEQALRETEAVYKSLVEGLPLNVFRKDPCRAGSSMPISGFATRSASPLPRDHREDRCRFFSRRASRRSIAAMTNM